MEPIEISEVLPEHVGREITGRTGGEWQKVIAVDTVGDAIWVKLARSGTYVTFAAKGRRLLKPLPEPKKNPSDRIREILNGFPATMDICAARYSAILKFLDEQAEREGEK